MSFISLLVVSKFYCRFRICHCFNLCCRLCTLSRSLFSVVAFMWCRSSSLLPFSHLLFLFSLFCIIAVFFFFFHIYCWLLKLSLSFVLSFIHLLFFIFCRYYFCSRAFIFLSPPPQWLSFSLMQSFSLLFIILLLPMCNFFFFSFWCRFLSFENYVISKTLCLFGRKHAYMLTLTNGQSHLDGVCSET